MHDHHREQPPAVREGLMSGYLVQTLTHRGWLFAMVVVHLVTGSAFLVGFVAHQLAIWLWINGRRKRRLAPPVAAVPAEGDSPADPVRDARGRM